MPTNKDFKRVIRARMRKTGESYTAARVQLLRKSAAPTEKPKPEPVSPARYQLVAGMSDRAIKQATGCTWERWVRALDRDKAYEWPHAQIARHVRSRYKTPSWWTQMVTVGYERIKGLRARGQQRDGSHRASRSKTFAVPVTALYQAFHDGSVRDRWLVDAAYSVRSGTKNKSLRLAFADGTSAVFGFTTKGPQKSQVAVEHAKLRSAEDAAARKVFWTSRFAALEKLLTS
jgi:hypothetical protein